MITAKKMRFYEKHSYDHWFKSDSQWNPYMHIPDIDFRQKLTEIWKTREPRHYITAITSVAARHFPEVSPLQVRNELEISDIEQMFYPSVLIPTVESDLRNIKSKMNGVEAVMITIDKHIQHAEVPYAVSIVIKVISGNGTVYSVDLQNAHRGA
jgi:hypothetical protein